MDILLAYAGLFAAAFLAATLLPAQSEAVLVALLFTDRYSVLMLLAVASAGNVLGSCVNYWVGRLLAGTRHFHRLVSERQLGHAEAWYRRYGRWSLLASWVPLIGDLIGSTAKGAKRTELIVFITPKIIRNGEEASRESQDLRDKMRNLTFN